MPKSARRPTPSPRRIRFSADPHDPPYWPEGLAACEKIDLLALASPEQFQAVHVIVDGVLREEWRRLSHVEILRLLALEDYAEPYHWKCDEPSVTKIGR